MTHPGGGTFCGSLLGSHAKVWRRNDKEENQVETSAEALWAERMVMTGFDRGREHCAGFSSAEEDGQRNTSRLCGDLTHVRRRTSQLIICHWSNAVHRPQSGLLRGAFAPLGKHQSFVRSGQLRDLLAQANNLLLHAFNQSALALAAASGGLLAFFFQFAQAALLARLGRPLRAGRAVLFAVNDRGELRIGPAPRPPTARCPTASTSSVTAR